MSTAPLVIEFIGLPGAGKTTIAQKAIEYLTSSGYRCFGLSTLDNPEGIEKKKGGFFSKLRTLYNFAFSCVMYRRLAINVFLFAINVKPLRLVNLQRSLLLLVRLKVMKTLMDGNYDLIIIDQGLIQYVWSIAVTGEHPSNIKYLERVLKSILEEISLFVIMVDVETELAVKRIVSRPTMRSRFDRMPASKAEAMLSKHKQIFSQIIDTAHTFRDTGYLNIDGSQPIPKNVSLIVPFIEQARQAYST